MTATIVPPDTIEAEPARRTARPIPTTTAAGAPSDRKKSLMSNS